MRNLLAILHIAIIPVIIYLISKKSEGYIFAAIIWLSVSIIASASEWLYFKKKLDRESFLSPFADKLLVLAVLLFLTIEQKFAWTILLLFILRDLTVGTIRLRAARDNIAIKGRWYGKIITGCELGIIFSALILEFLDHGPKTAFIPLFQFMRSMLITTAIVISLFSIIHYTTVYGTKIRRERLHGIVVNHEKTIILANQKSGGFHDSYRRHLLKLFAQRRKAKIVLLPQTTEMFSGINALIKPYRQIIIAGGDGSFESALNHPVFKHKSLGFFPLGAGNSYYSYFYKGKRFEYLRSRFKFREIPLDILELEFNGQRIQTTFLSIGIDAEVIKQMKLVKHHNFANYFRAGSIVAFGPKQTYSISCEVDDQRYEWNNCFNLIISKIPFIGYGLRSTIGEIECNDGFILGMAQVNIHSPFFNKGLRLWSMLLTQLGLNKAPVVSLKGKHFHITSKREFSLQAGGEFLGYTKEFSVRVKRQQKVLVI